MSSTDTSLSSTTVLLVEDNPADADLVREYLSAITDQLYEIVHVTTGEEALETSSTVDFDVLLLDLGLPDLNGSNVLARMQSLTDEVPTVVLTGIDSEAIGIEALQRGVEEFMEKQHLDGPLLAQTIDHAIERHRIQRELQAQRRDLRRYQTIIENASDRVYVKDADGRFRLANEKVAELYDMDKSELIGKRSTEIVGEETGGRMEERDARALEADEAITTHEHYEIDGQERVFEVTRIPFRTDAQQDGLIGISRELTERTKMRADLEKMAREDQLTGMPNRRHFDEALAETLEESRHNASGFAAAIVDIDNLKSINNSLGHAAGDTAIRLVGERLEACLRQSDLVARYGGDEFTILLRELESAQHIDAIGQRICEAFDAPFEIRETDVHMSVSIGFSHAPCREAAEQDSGLDIEEVARAAERAVSTAKARTGSTWEIFDPFSEGSPDERVQKETRIRESLEARDFLPFYQPIFRLADLQLTGLEVLARWSPSADELIGPGDFLPLAEESALICKIADQLLERIQLDLADAPELHDRESPLQIFFNVSHRRLEDSEELDRLLTLAGAVRSTGAEMCLEVTETEFLNNPAPIERLREAGFPILIDDFGTGYSSLSRLKDLPADGLKLDMEFVQGVTREPGDAAIVDTVAQLGERLNLPVIAEGAETARQLEYLRTTACTYVQGYHLARPMPFGKLRESGLEKPAWRRGE